MTMIMSSPVFTSKKKALAWIKAFDKAMKGKSKSEVVK